MGRKIGLLLSVISLSYGCAVVPMATVFAGISAASTAGNQTYQAYLAKIEGDEIMRCVPQEDKSFICKPERNKPDSAGAGKDSSPSPLATP